MVDLSTILLSATATLSSITALMKVFQISRQVLEVHLTMNSKLDELVNVTRKLARAEGIAEGIATGAATELARSIASQVGVAAAHQMTPGPTVLVVPQQVVHPISMPLPEPVIVTIKKTGSK